ncbi:hypothetical protein B484DRAFT_438561, partial [Ochromonadaceae sp. CCMP2298]
VAPTAAPTFFRVKARIANSIKFRAWRARVYCLADECKGLYDADAKKTIYYEGDALVLSLLFEKRRDAHDFVSALERRALGFSLISLVTIDSEEEEVHPIERPSWIRATHYVHGDSDPPLHSLATSDYRSAVGDDEEDLVLGDINDAYQQLQMIEKPNHPLLYGKALYRCHLEAQASNKAAASDPNNILMLSWITHQVFDGLNLTTKQHMVPSIAVEFVAFEGRETKELVGGYPIEKDRVRLSIESPDPKILEGVGMLLKDGSEFRDGRWFTYVHVDSHESFHRFLSIKYNETKRLWDKGLQIDEPLPEEDLPPAKKPRTRNSLKLPSK